MTFQCPSCDKTLRLNAKSCECGWEQTPSPKGGKSSLLEHSLDHQCIYNDHGTRCRYPVNFFEPGQTRAMCRYHKKYLGDMDMCRKILDRSHRDTDLEYQIRSDKETYGESGSRLERDLLERLYPLAFPDEKKEAA